MKAPKAGGGRWRWKEYNSRGALGRTGTPGVVLRLLSIRRCLCQGRTRSPSRSVCGYCPSGTVLFLRENNPWSQKSSRPGGTRPKLTSYGGGPLAGYPTPAPALTTLSSGVFDRSSRSSTTHPLLFFVLSATPATILSNIRALYAQIWLRFYILWAQTPTLSDEPGVQASGLAKLLSEIDDE
ncbi:hypothetical protein BOTBODRAFT_186279 [Botryobasidium botryosum FD-172 SS1]|uniref:Uncharacterized protein n=1 Tax=Botryobasidium botryosum (strain FD-172 SS1) TaxID=930990 RepID=A0A067N031_BOTB1|nr:hypothetical protein BOTBODRAFT_186279 [Botryobasidium botryosum FD-172 SS1]